MRKAVCVAVSLMLVLACCGCAGGVGGEAESSEQDSVHQNLVAHTSEDFQYLSIERLPKGYEGYYNERLWVHPPSNSVKYQVEIVSDYCALRLSFLCAEGQLERDASSRKPNGDGYVKTTENGHWYVYASRAEVYNNEYRYAFPDVKLYPTNDALAGAVYIHPKNPLGIYGEYNYYDDYIYYQDDEDYYERLLEEALKFAECISECSYTMNQFSEDIKNAS